MDYGVSTHLYHDVRLEAAHLEEIAAHGFEAVEVFATRSHFDYHDERAIDALGGWLRATGLRLHGIHAPIMERFVAGHWAGRTYSLAAADPGRRAEAVRETLAALALARRVPARVLVVHLGVPAGQTAPAPDTLDAARRSLEEIGRAAAEAGVRVALEVIPNALSTPAALVRLLEEDPPLEHAGICLDFGHAFLLGGVADAIEEAGGHLISTHVHDNDGRADDHRVPFEGGIDWAEALMAVQKVGYDGTLLFELANRSTPADVLARARGVRARFDAMLAAGREASGGAPIEG
ncbi:MAG TPA: sugar phosphate isomerase/epimerase family protein [Vicinamibacterales bacterium]|nr:sugar phosphate isomerase/epimerase family protein [Vicinamibacterales bacterium]